MRMIVTGVKDGKTCVVEDTDHSESHDRLTLSPMIELQPGSLPPRPPSAAGHLGAGVDPGVLKWFRVQFPPGEYADTHYTDTIDLHTIISGSVELILDDGVHRLEAGDTAMITGVSHAWRAGPEGCLTSIVILGTPPPA